MMDGILGYVISAIAGATLAAIGITLWFRRRGADSTLARRLRRHVMRGAYKALEEDYTGAVNEFSEIVQADPDEPDSYFVLGRLFRKAGQFARAARIHQTLMLRHDDRSGEVKKRAMFELAEDFRAAGLLDRAADTYAELIDLAPQWQEPQENLIAIALKGRLWEKAAVYLPRLEKLSGKPRDELTAHVLAERALQLIAQNETASARKLLKQALKRRPQSAHTAFAFAHLHAADQKRKHTFAAMKEALEHAPEALPLVLDALYDLSQQNGWQERFDEFLLDRLPAGDNTAAPHWALVSWQVQRHIDNDEHSLAREKLRELIEAGIDTPKLREMAERQMVGIPENWPQSAGHWRCNHCNHAHDTLSWFCPACTSWGTVDKIDFHHSEEKQ